MKIVPALLAENLDDFLVRLRQAESFADYVQIDLMDGVFVPTKSFPPEKINEIETSLTFELHLMVENPLDLVNRLDNPGLRKAIFHVEASGDHRALIERIRQRKLGAGLAIKPETGIDACRELAEQVDTLLFLTVDPCCYGNPFKEEVLGKIARARRMFPEKTIAVDGAVSLDNLEEIRNAGVDQACVGSRIFLHSDPAENYRLFAEKLREMGG